MASVLPMLLCTIYIHIFLVSFACFTRFGEMLMARVTVEDCVLRVSNRFKLVMLASQRARAVSSGASITVDRDNDKNPVIALREIAEETVSVDELENALIKDQQKHVEIDEPEVDELDFIAIQQQMTEVDEAPADEIVAEDLLAIEDEALLASND